MKNLLVLAIALALTACSKGDARQDPAAAPPAVPVSAIQVAPARVRQSELNLSYTTVDAPIAGVTGRAQQSVGSLVTPNSDSSLLTSIVKTDPVWVRFALSEMEFARLRSRETKAPEVKLE